MRRVLIGLIAIMMAGQLWADRLRSTTVACPDVKTLKALERLSGDFKAKNLFILQHGCKVLTPKDAIHVLEPDDTCCGVYYRIQVDASGDILYVKKFSVIVEQSDSNVIRF